MDNDISSRLKQARIAQGLSLKELGEKVGLSESTVQRYESGFRRALSTEKLKTFAEVLQVDVWWLFKGEKRQDKITIDGSTFTPEEETEIRNFIKYLLSKR